LIDGKAVPANVGRWTKQEHATFVAALQEYGKSWKKIAEQVKTRTVIQTRTHAQKYYQKLEKTAEKVLQQSGGSGVVVPTIDKSTAAKKDQEAVAGTLPEAPVIAVAESGALAAAAAAAAEAKATDTDEEEIRKIVEDAMDPAALEEAAGKKTSKASPKGGKRKAAEAKASPPRETRSRRAKIDKIEKV